MYNWRCLNVDALRKPKFHHFIKKMEEQKNQTTVSLVSFRMFMIYAW